ncbi:hypothetical protein C7I55_26205 [Sphingomonas deserti]|uniref:Uncharacterized protein n=1 Tax=Allosphingosinicella deserti TaxID=2116704 RepID=A0A2P7QF13_9SPHN|nr:hypothetical protein C7I55_26205 [Sphingomonas deserti]
MEHDDALGDGDPFGVAVRVSLVAQLERAKSSCRDRIFIQKAADCDQPLSTRPEIRLAKHS